MLRLTLVVGLWLASACAYAVDYPIVVSVQRRPDDKKLLKTHEANRPHAVEGNTDLMIIQPDGSLTMLVDAGPREAIIDPCVSFDGTQVYYAKFWNVASPTAGADIFRVDVASGVSTQLTNGEMRPNAINQRRAAGRSYNLGPCELPDGLVAFTSTRNDYTRPKADDRPVHQLFVMDQDGRNVEQTGFLNLMGALHPVVLTDGRIMWSSHEGQGLRDDTEHGNRLWGLWASKPDGRTWEPLISAFTDAAVYHFHAQLSNGSIVCEEYYTSNNSGYGTLFRFSPHAASLGTPPFGTPNHTENRYDGTGFSFAPPNMTALTPFALGRDDWPAAEDKSTGRRVGKLTHPASAPGNDLLAVWSNWTPAHNNLSPNTPRVQATVVIIPQGEPAAGPSQLKIVKSDPAYNFYQPHALVPYSAIYGISEPAAVPFVPNDGEHAARGLPAGTPFGLIGTSTFYKRDDSPGKNQWGHTGLSPFNPSHGQSGTNWAYQGSVAGLTTNEEIYAVRVLSMEPRSMGENGFASHGMERLRIMGEIPLRKFKDDGSPILDVDGNPDTSFLAKIPADVPFTFQMLNSDGQAMNMSQTWHQVRPGEARYDCGGCHAHSQVGTKFESTAAAQLSYAIADLTAKPVDVEFKRDVLPILEESCVSCHGGDEPAALLDLSQADALLRLAADHGEKSLSGIPPLIGRWAGQNASRYVRKFQSRRSLLAWKLLGKRTDGWTNEDFPTETTPGDPKTFPGGASKENLNKADLDYVDGGCEAQQIAADDKRTIIRWIDLGCPGGNGWFRDATRPTLALSSPRRQHAGPLSEIKVGLFDHYSGLNTGSFSVKADFMVNGRKPGTELAELFTASDSIWTLRLRKPFIGQGNLRVEVRDNAGNRQELIRTFATVNVPRIELPDRTTRLPGPLPDQPPPGEQAKSPVQISAKSRAP